MTIKSQDLAPLPLWEHWPQARLLKEKSDNPRMFARGFEMKAFTDDERMFPSFKSCYTPGVVLGEVIRRRWPTFIGVDLAGQKRPGNVIFAAALDPQTHRRFPVEIHTGNWSSPELAKRLAQVHDRHDTRYIMVENNGYQQSLIDWIRHMPQNEVPNNFYYKIEAFTTGSNKISMEVGLPSLEVEFKNRAWVIAQDEFVAHPPGHRNCGWCTWSSECEDYPMSATTDCVMAMWFCREAIARWGVAIGSKTLDLSDVNIR